MIKLSMPRLYQLNQNLWAGRCHQPFLLVIPIGSCDWEPPIYIHNSHLILIDTPCSWSKVFILQMKNWGLERNLSKIHNWQVAEQEIKFRSVWFHMQVTGVSCSKDWAPYALVSGSSSMWREWLQPDIPSLSVALFSLCEFKETVLQVINDKHVPFF